jgi:predicted unusual protein kinase regulating ubiquinone biosynthesis (AarF/ABC1/UbiB family)
MDENTLLKRLQRYSNSSATFAALSAKFITSHQLDPQDLVKHLGSLRGPLMKVAQLLSMVPDILPEPYAQALSVLQSQAPSMGGLFVKRRMKSELGPNWERHFKTFNLEPFAAASIGQVHKAQNERGDWLACKLQYPHMQGIIEADLAQFRLLLSLYESRGGSLKTGQFLEEIQHYLYEEISYKKEAQNIHLFQKIFNTYPNISIPQVFPSLSTDRLLTMSYMRGYSLEDFSKESLGVRNKAAKNLFFSWYYPLYAHGYLHGDPHAGNYLFSEEGEISLLDFGCVRYFSPSFLLGVRQLYEALKTNKEDLLINAYQQWGFKNLTKELAQTLTLWARFLYGPVLEDRIRPIAEAYNGQEGRRIAKEVLKKLKVHGKVELPREFILMDRVAVGMGAAFIKLKAELNWHQLFEEILNQAGFLSRYERDIPQQIQDDVNHCKGNKS